MAETSQQKTEKPTPRRLREARKKGQVSFSRDASSALGFVIATLAIFALVSATALAFEELYSRAVELTRTDQLGSGSLSAAGMDALGRVPRVLLPLLLGLFMVGIGIGLAQTKFLFSAYPLKPELKKLNPMTRLKQWFSVGGLFEFAKTGLKMVIALWIAYLVIRGSLHDILRLSLVDADALTTFLAGLLRQFLIIICVLFVAAGGLDFLFQRWKFGRDQRMTKEEVKRDYKEMEGDPQIRSQRKSLHRQIGSFDLQQAVSSAKVVLTESTQHVVVIGYDRETMPAPKVVAKGQGRFGRRLLDMAAKADVPVLEHASAARALFRVAPDSYIPREHFETMAEILTEVENQRRQQFDPFAA